MLEWGGHRTPNGCWGGGLGFNQNNIKLRKGSLIIDFGGGDAVHMLYLNEDDPLANPEFASIQFDDGTSLSWEYLCQGQRCVAVNDEAFENRLMKTEWRSAA